MKTLLVRSNISTHNEFLQLVSDVKSTVSVSISVGIYYWLAKKFDLTPSVFNFLYNLYSCPLVPPRGLHLKHCRSSTKPKKTIL